jgi:CBS-domain-containing membrane protein
MVCVNGLAATGTNVPNSQDQRRAIGMATVVTATTDTAFQQLVDVMLRHGIGGIPVVDEHGWPIGIVTEADLVSKEAYGRRRRRLLDVAAARPARRLRRRFRHIVGAQWRRDAPRRSLESRSRSPR